METLDNIGKRFYLEDSLIPQTQIAPSSPETKPSATPIATESATTEEQTQSQETASPSAALEQP